MVRFVFTRFSQRRFQKIPAAVQQRIIKKLKALKDHSDILTVLKPLQSMQPATHRLRIGDYRLILQVTNQQPLSIDCIVLDVGHRRDIYR